MTSCGGQGEASGLGGGEEVAQPIGRGHTHVRPVPKGGIEGLSVGQKELPNVTQAGDRSETVSLLLYFFQ